MATLGFAGSTVALLAVAALPALLLELLGYPSRIGRLCERLFRRRGAWPLVRRVRWAERVRPERPPIEELAIQLRRLSAVLTAPGPVSSVRRFGVERAYDETLAKACASLGIEQDLGAVDPEDREFERLRVEAMVQEAGVAVRCPGSGGALPRRRPAPGTGEGRG
jgi:hypothetical protein